MDDLTYQYYAGTNRLKRVTDIVPANKVGNNPGDKIIDIDSQVDEENYVYDSIGNLIQDKAEKITNINWNVYGKIVGISRNAGTQVPASEIGYTYDAGGNRIGKAVTKNDSSYHTWYVRDAQGNVMATYSSSKGSSNNLPAFELEESERYLYGSSRLGVVNVAQNVDNSNGGPVEATINKVDTFWRGLRAYELSNHLGNVLVTISDRKKGVADPVNAALIKFFEPVMLSGTDYYPFGMPMRVGGDSSYRYGFNGKENDNEVKGGDGLQQDYGMRVYDNRLGRFLSVDPLSTSFPWNSPYSYAEGDPINYIDLDGLEKPEEKAQAEQAKKDAEAVIKTYSGNRALIALRGNNDALYNANSLGLYDFFGGNHLEEYEDPEDQAAYLRGRIVGDGIAIAQGITQAEVGGGTAAAGLATGPGAVVVSTSGVIVAAHGGGVTATGVSDLAWTLKKLYNLNMVSQGSTDNSTSQQQNSAQNSGSDIPDRVKSRINIANGATRYTPQKKSGAESKAGLEHVVEEHFNRELANSRSVFSITVDKLKQILQSKAVVSTKVRNMGGGFYERVANTGQVVGNAAKKEGGQATSWIKVITDEAGNLITTYPVKGTP